MPYNATRDPLAEIISMIEPHHHGFHGPQPKFNHGPELVQRDAAIERFWERVREIVKEEIGERDRLMEGGTSDT